MTWFVECGFCSWLLFQVDPVKIGVKPRKLGGSSQVSLRKIISLQLMMLMGSEIRRSPVEYGESTDYLQGFVHHVRWLRMSEPSTVWPPKNENLWESMISFSSWEFKGQKQAQRKTPMEGRRRVRRCVRATKAPVFVCYLPIGQVDSLLNLGLFQQFQDWVCVFHSTKKVTLMILDNQEMFVTRKPYKRKKTCQDLVSCRYLVYWSGEDVVGVFVQWNVQACLPFFWCL